MGRKINLPSTPKRIISLVPSQTELLFDLGLEDEILGLTKFCIHPSEKIKDKVRIGGTKSYHFDKINALNPDLIIGNKEENDQAQIEELMKEYPVWMSDVKNLESALEMIENIGNVLGKSSESKALSTKIKTEFSQLQPSKPLLKTAYFIWRKPYMVAGNGTFINEMMKLSGFQNIYANQNRYPTTNLIDLKDQNPEVILLPSEPFPFSEKYVDEFKEHCPNAIIKLVDGELFSWYGSRLMYAPKYFSQLFTEILESQNS